MSTLADIEAAIEALPARQKIELLSFLTSRIEQGARHGRKRGLKAAALPPIEGLPAELSMGRF